ncbi:calcium-activated chloride channel regulator 1-like [Oratosquilla oratoria]|uniref:calcium-activated chloride channel regulator 1-like n=1 Tax=Oratosquilla oratoria TaxID=337810 RepID=UPI003F75D97A
MLYRATRNRAFFRSVTVVVPPTWSGAHCSRQLNHTSAPMQEPALVVSRPHPVYAHTPWTLQVGGCGAPGERMHMTQEYLTARNQSESVGDAGRVLVQEWAKFRWGVMEEYGHLGDPLYPPYHRTSVHDHAPTGCSNIPVQGTPSSCDPQRETCHFIPSVSKNNGVTSSLLYMHFLPHVTEFCNKQTHDPKSPTKHNVLCQGRSAWEVMQRHSDFSDDRNLPGNSSRDVRPMFNYVKPAPKRFIIVVEDTTVMNAQKRWDFLRKAVRKLLVYDVPAASEVGVVLFDQTAYTKLPLTPTPSTLEDRQRLATSSLPRNPSQVPEGHKCLICGLDEAVRNLEGGARSAEGGIIIFITAGSHLPLQDDGIRELGQVVIEKRVRVVPVIYPVRDRNPEPAPGVEYLALLSGTQSFTVVDEGIGSDSKVSMMVSLMDALYSALRIFLPSANDLPLVVHKEEYRGGIMSVSKGSFTIDETLGGEVRFAVTYYDLGHVGNMVSLIDPLERVQENLNSQEEDGDVNMIFVTVHDAMPGEWNYRVENRADSHQSLFISVQATPRTPSGSGRMGHFPQLTGEAITLHAWTSQGAAPINSTRSDGAMPPVIVYAQVSVGGVSPVVDADVEAVLLRLGYNKTGSPYDPLTFKLFDNGNGDPDITKGDGVYSRYLRALEDTPARYTFTVRLTDNSGRAAIVKPTPSPAPMAPNSDFSYIENYVHQPITERGPRFTRALPYDPAAPHCCGSVVPYTNTQLTGKLSRAVSVGVIDVVGTTVSPGMTPPSRVADLRAEVNVATLQVTFYWTAPGAYRDHGVASHYEVVFSRDITAVAQGHGKKIEGWTDPLQAGMSSVHMMRWLRHDTVYFIAIRAVGRAGAAGEWSNVAEVFMPHPPTTTEIYTRGSTQGGVIGMGIGGALGELGTTTPQPGSISTRDILAMVGAGCGLLIIILLLAVYYIVVVGRRRRQHQEKQKNIEIVDCPPMSKTSGEGDPESETDSISKPPPPENMVAADITEVPATRSLSPVQSWPASKLLAEHERRQGPDESVDGVNPPDEMSPNQQQPQHLHIQQHHHPDLGVPYMPQPAPPHPFYYHTPNGHYIEDTLPMDGGSLVSTQPSESLLVYNVDTSVTESYRAPSSAAPTPVSWDGTTGRRSAPMKVPPPTLPKPTLPSHLTLSGSASTGSLTNERKRRNVTQV